MEVIRNLIKLHFVSRHQPTAKQVELAFEKGYELVFMGDLDAFDLQVVEQFLYRIKLQNEVPAVACVHPLIAAQAILTGCELGVFENKNRAPEGERPTFEAVSLRMVYPE